MNVCKNELHRNKEKNEFINSKNSKKNNTLQFSQK